MNRSGIRANEWTNSHFDSSLSSPLNDTNFYCLFNVRADTAEQENINKYSMRVPQPIWGWPTSVSGQRTHPLKRNILGKVRMRVHQTKPQTIMINNYIMELLPEDKIAFVKAAETPDKPSTTIPLSQFWKKNCLMGFSIRIMVRRCGRLKCITPSWKKGQKGRKRRRVQARNCHSKYSSTSRPKCAGISQTWLKCLPLPHTHGKVEIKEPGRKGLVAGHGPDEGKRPH